MPHIVAPATAGGYINGPQGTAPGAFVNGAVLTPQIAAQFATSINTVMDGTISLSGVTIDGTGGSTSSLTPAGTLKLSASASSATAGGTTVGIGQMYKEGAPLALLSFNAANPVVVNRCYNIATCSRTATGRYAVTLSTAATNRLIVNATYVPSGTGSFNYFLSVTNLSTSGFEIDFVNGSTLTDPSNDIHVTVFGL